MQSGSGGTVRPDQVIALLEEDLARAGYELVDVRIFLGGGRLQVRVYVDTLAGGITLDEVAAASRTVSMLMEEADLVDGRYVIEVSSPGIRRPLRKASHFEAACGRQVELKVAGAERPRRLRGVLREAGAEALVVEVAAGEDGSVLETVAVADVLEANLNPEFDVQALINADRRQRKQQKRDDRKARAEARGRKGRSRDKTSRGKGPAEGPADPTGD